MNLLEYKNQINKGFFKDEWYVLGLDLGNTNCTLSYFNNKLKKVEAIDLSMGFGKIPFNSTLQYRESTNEWVFGQEANNTGIMYSDSTVYECISLLGTEEKISIGSDFYTPEEVIAKVVKNIVDNLFKIYPKAEIIGLVVTYSDEINDQRKKSLNNVIEQIGLKDKLINQVPTYASILQSFLLDEKVADENILIFNYGGKSLNTSIVNVKNNQATLLNHNKKIDICGNIVDSILLEKFYSFIKENGIDTNSLTNENNAELKSKVTETKERLSGSDSARVPFTFCVPPFMKQISISEFEELIEEVIIKTRKSVESLVRDTNNIDFDKIDRVILSGGSSKMTWVRKMFAELLGDDSKIYTSSTPELDATIGATTICAKEFNLIEEEIVSFVETDVDNDHEMSFDIGLNLDNFITLIKKGASINYCKGTTIIKANSKSIDIQFAKKIDDNIIGFDLITFDELPYENETIKLELIVNLIQNGKKLKIRLKEILNERQTHSTYDKICVIEIIK